MALRIGLAQHTGRRDRQEDCAALLHQSSDPSGAVIVLADGMGGHPAGDQASWCAVNGFLSSWLHCQPAGHPPERAAFRKALDHANAAIKAAQEAEPAFAGMGCTCLAAVIHGRQLGWVSVGDCLLFRFSGGSLTRLNADHSMAPVLKRLAEDGEIAHDAARNHPDRHALISALTGGSIGLVDCPATWLPLQPGDRVLLASDGVLTLEPAMIARCLAKGAGLDPQQAADRLLAAVMAGDAPDQDNVTLLLAEIDAPPPAPPLRSPDHRTVTFVGLVLCGAVLALVLLLLLGQLAFPPAPEAAG